MAKLIYDPDALEEFCSENDISFLGLFGSFPRDEDVEASDVDLLVKFGKPKGFFDLVEIEENISVLLGREVDLVTEGALSPYIRVSVMSDLQPLYDVQKAKML